MGRDFADARDAVKVLDGVCLAQLVNAVRATVQRLQSESSTGVAIHSHAHEQPGVVNPDEPTVSGDRAERVVTTDAVNGVPMDESRIAKNRSDSNGINSDVFVPPRQTPSLAKEGDE